MALFLFLSTLIGGIAFANEGGDKYVEQYGAKAYVQHLAENREPVNYSKLNNK